MKNIEIWAILYNWTIADKKEISSKLRTLQADITQQTINVSQTYYFNLPQQANNTRNKNCIYRI